MSIVQRAFTRRGPSCCAFSLETTLQLHLLFHLSLKGSPVLRQKPLRSPAIRSWLKNYTKTAFMSPSIVTVIAL
jgi:hypothetical protein